VKLSKGSSEERAPMHYSMAIQSPHTSREELSRLCEGQHVQGLVYVVGSIKEQTAEEGSQLWAAISTWVWTANGFKASVLKEKLRKQQKSSSH